MKSNKSNKRMFEFVSDPTEGHAEVRRLRDGSESLVAVYIGLAMIFVVFELLYVEEVSRLLVIVLVMAFSYGIWKSERRLRSDTIEALLELENRVKKLENQNKT